MNFETVQTISHSDAITTLFVFFYILNCLQKSHSGHLMGNLFKLHVCYIRYDLPFSYKAIWLFAPHFSLSIPGHVEQSEPLFSDLSIKLP